MRSSLTVLAVVSAACGSPTTTASAPPPVANVPAPAAPPAISVPADTITIARMSGVDGAVLGYIRSMFREGPLRAPPCFDQITGRIEDQYQLEIGDRLRQVQVFVGAFDRDAVERCVDEVGDAFGVITGHDRSVGLRAERDGELTKLTQVSRVTKMAWIAWGPRRAVVAGDPALARDTLGGAHLMAADAPLVRLWAHTAGADVRIATVRDFTSHALGVPSWGAIVTMSKDAMKMGGHAPVRLELASEDDAARALAALLALPQAPGASPAWARMVELLAPRQDKAELIVDAGPLFTAPDGLATLQALVGTP